MRIKSLALFGFKSFPERTTLYFEPGITAIVGPNGCGKSNIVDALRWVLGEQNPRVLRGKGMEDVIFKGSASRKAQGLAEVLLTLSDAEELASLVPTGVGTGLPEVMVSRRLYRSGESEYAINRTVCRLKDVTDLFLNQGISSRIYSIMEQSHINQVLSPKGDERRLLIEEAAGISKYRERKKEALLKLEATTNNLARIEDVIAEVRRQRDSSKRQAAAAERYRRLKEELRQLELTVARHRLSQLTWQLGQNQEKLASLRDKEKELTLAQRQRRGELADGDQKLASLEQAARQFREELARMDGQLIQCQATIWSAQQQLEGITKQEGSLSEEMNSLAHTLEEVRQERLRVSQEKEENQQTLAELLKEEEALEGRVQRATALLSDQSARCERAREELFHLHEQLANQQARLAEINKEIERNEKEARDGLKELQEATGRLSHLEEERDRLLPRCQELRESLKQGAQEKEVLAAELKGIGSVLTEKKKAYEELKEKCQAWRAQLTALKEMEEKGAGCRPAVQEFTQLWKRNPAAFEPILGMLADYLEVEERFQKALQAIAGEKLQYFLVKDAGAMDRFFSLSLGPVGFIPVAGLPSLEFPPSLLEKKGVLGPLSHFLKVPEECRAVVTALFSQWVVVEDWARVIELRSQGEIQTNLVTLQGELAYANGIMVTGASAGQEEIPTKVGTARKRQGRELERMLSEKEAELKDAQKEVADSEGEAQKLREQLERLDLALAHNQIEAASLEGRISSQDQQEARAREAVRLFSSEAERLKEEIARLTGSRDQASAQILELIRLKEKGQNQQEQLQSQVDRLKEEMAQLTASLTKTKIEAAARQERLQGITFSLSQAERLIQQREAELIRKNQQRQELELEQTRLSQQLDSGRLDQQRLTREKEEAQARLARGEPQRQSLLMRQEELEQVLAELEPAASILNEELRSQELATSRCQWETEHLVAKIKEEYGVELAPDPENQEKEGPGEETLSRLNKLKADLERVGSVNLLALEEYQQLEERYRLLTSQHQDLCASIEELRKTIAQIEATCRQRFRETFEEANDKFNQLFRQLFQGGRAQLILASEDDPLEAGVEMMVEPPGKRLQNALLLSTGERALTAFALIFALFLIKPSPFCFLDEIDAPLDDTNIARLNSLIKEAAERSQLVLITHNKKSMEVAATLYGITMEEPGVSKLVSVKLN